MRKLTAAIVFSTLCSVLPSASLDAQGIAGVSAIGGPQYVNYKISISGAAKSVTQLSIPIAVIVPITDRLTLDVSSAWADSRVSSNGTETSKINGLTDTQVRGNFSMFDGTAIFTLGVNVPTGMYKVPDAQQEAAGQIGNDFLLYPVSSMGSGGAVTGGVAVARTAGAWNLGLGGSFRYSQPFDAYEIQNAVLRFEPGSETRLRLGADRAVGYGRLSLAATYSAFTDDKADSTTFATGARTLGQASFYWPTDNGNDWTISVWDLYRAQGQQIGTAAPSENISNLNVAYGMYFGDVYVQPSLEGRAWTRDGEKAGTTGAGGVRLRFDAMGMSINPSVTYSIGSVYPAGGGSSIDVSGLRFSLLVRWQ